jgi:hypothetical protein
MIAPALRSKCRHQPMSAAAEKYRCRTYTRPSKNHRCRTYTPRRARKRDCDQRRELTRTDHRKIIAAGPISPSAGDMATGAVMPTLANAVLASASRAPCRSVQHRKCSQACLVGSMPWRTSGSCACSPLPQARQRPGRRWHRVMVQPFIDRAGKSLRLGLGTRQPAIELGNAGPLVKERPPVLVRPAVIRRPQQRDDTGFVARQLARQCLRILRPLLPPDDRIGRYLVKDAQKIRGGLPSTIPALPSGDDARRRPDRPRS